jgi:hypothetical protein
VYATGLAGVKFTVNENTWPGCSWSGVRIPNGPVKPAPATASVATVIACVVEFDNVNVHSVADPLCTCPKSTGSAPAHGANAVTVTAATDVPNRIVLIPFT